jgi:hypothetical protein
MRIMAASACKRDASKTPLIQRGNPEKPRARGGFDLGNCSRKLHAIQAHNCVTIVILESTWNRTWNREVTGFANGAAHRQQE